MYLWFVWAWIEGVKVERTSRTRTHIQNNDNKINFILKQARDRHTNTYTHAHDSNNESWILWGEEKEAYVSCESVDISTERWRWARKNKRRIDAKTTKWKLTAYIKYGSSPDENVFGHLDALLAATTTATSHLYTIESRKLKAWVNVMCYTKCRWKKNYASTTTPSRKKSNFRMYPHDPRMEMMLAPWCGRRFMRWNFACNRRTYRNWCAEKYDMRMLNWCVSSEWLDDLS